MDTIYRQRVRQILTGVPEDSLNRARRLLRDSFGIHTVTACLSGLSDADYCFLVQVLPVAAPHLGKWRGMLLGEINRALARRMQETVVGL